MSQDFPSGAAVPVNFVPNLTYLALPLFSSNPPLNATRPPYTAVPHLALPDLHAARPPLTFSRRPAKLHEDNLVPLSCINLIPQFGGGLGGVGELEGSVGLACFDFTSRAE